MLDIDYKTLVGKLVGKQVARPSASGRMPGHIVSNAFVPTVYEELQKMGLPDDILWYQHDYLNDLYSKNPAAKTCQDRHDLIKNPTVQLLLNRGEEPTTKWTSAEGDKFSDKQDDTADILITDGCQYEIIDVKTRVKQSKSRGGNIISALKILNVCARIIESEENECNQFNIAYINIEWQEDKKGLVCCAAHYKSLFLIPPSKLYINWTAGKQIQLRLSGPDEILQSYQDGRKQWAREYTAHYKASLKRWMQNWLEKDADFKELVKNLVK